MCVSSERWSLGFWSCSLEGLALVLFPLSPWWQWLTGRKGGGGGKQRRRTVGLPAGCALNSWTPTSRRGCVFFACQSRRGQWEVVGLSHIGPLTRPQKRGELWGDTGIRSEGTAGGGAQTNPNTPQEHQHKGCSIKAGPVRSVLGRINAFNVNFIKRYFNLLLSSG